MMSLATIWMVVSMVLAAQTPVQRVSISVIDEAGRPIIREAPEARVWEGGEPRTVVSATRADAPPAVVVIVHTFRMGDTIDVRKALSSFIDALERDRAGARIALMTAVAPVRLADLETVAPEVRAAIDRFARTETNLRLVEAIDDACAVLAREATDRRHVVVITNAPDAERMAASFTIATLRAAGAALWVLDIGGSTTYEQHVLFQDGTRDSGGLYQPLRTPQLLPAASERVAHLIANQILVLFTRAAGEGPGELRIEVDGPPGHRVLAPVWAHVRQPQ